MEQRDEPDQRGPTTGETRIDGVLFERRPLGDAAPVVFDSPHSGTVRPADFDTIVPSEMLRRSEDMFVDELFADVPVVGGVLIAAQFPRAYIDPNRGLKDLDQRLLDAPWPEPLRPGDKSRMGHGLVWRVCPPDLPMYDRRLSPNEVVRRIEGYWRPYHRCMSHTMDRLHQNFGSVWHVNCHSMPASAPAQAGAVNGSRFVDFVLGDRDGTTCDRAFTRMVADALRGFGYRVTINDPYKGVELVRAFGAPDAGRHSLQIEINRALYMNEATFERNAGFADLRANMASLAAAICDYARAQSA